ncbi:lipoprotein [Echinimonas agarilytica]|uniref:Type IV secretion system putative lipoprotein virB7 n=1 Tax=Echinimonas agarilytica TaxID=1215918 RepID=A0AA42B6N5_9GAMM|nr:lipoprotein [Echinimonas agarilytica]MCM2678850.1 lipoprotein [Echinimonas agarilytica]
MKKILISATLVVLLSACQEATDASSGVQIPEGFKMCPEVRPEICTMEYAPVDGVDANGNLAEYSNSCGACANPDVVAVGPLKSTTE